MRTTEQTERARPRFPAPGWWVRNRDGEVAVVQMPNAALCVWLACAVLTRLPSGDGSHTASHVGDGALLAWSLDEVLRGSSPVRRVLGAVVMVVVLQGVLS